MITMLLGGLWQGPAWNFVLWRFYQGALLSVYRIWTAILIESQPQAITGVKLDMWARRMQHVAANLIFLLFVCYGFLPLRAHSFSQIFHLVPFGWRLWRPRLRGRCPPAFFAYRDTPASVS